LPKEIEETVMTVLAAEYYVLGGRLVNGGRKLTSYTKALKPFVTIKEEAHRAVIGRGTPNTGKEIVSWFESLIVTTPPKKSASIFFRALAYGQWRMDNRQSEDDNLLDAFYVAFTAIYIIAGNGSSPKMQSCKKEIQESINAHFQKYGVYFQSDLRVTLMDCRNLVWCLCKLFLDVGMIVRDKIATNKYELLLPDPYRDTITEQINIANLCIECRRENHPCSYYAAYNMIVDVKDLVSPSCANSLLSNALKIARLGKDAAINSSNNYFSFVFLSIESFWIPTSLWPRSDAITYKCMRERLSQAQKFKDQCSKHTEENLLYAASSYKHQLKAFLKSLTKSGAISTSDEFLIPLYGLNLTHIVLFALQTRRITSRAENLTGFQRDLLAAFAQKLFPDFYVVQDAKGRITATGSVKRCIGKMATKKVVKFKLIKIRRVRASPKSPALHYYTLM